MTRTRLGKNSKIVKTEDSPGSPAELKILVASHSHPQLSKGGAEISAYQLFSELKILTGYNAWFLGCDTRQRLAKVGTTITQPFSDREYLYAIGAFDWFKFANVDTGFPKEFRRLLKRLQPQVVHFHHYLGFGVEAFYHVKETLPDCKIVLTLHEYLAICHHYGQMITSPDRHLCYESSPIACAGCFNSIPSSDFFLRKLYIQRFFDVVDHFIAPSQFLAGRYTDWGIASSRISVVENVIPAKQISRRSSAMEDNVLRAGFFGQISPLKGIRVLFEAAAILQNQNNNNIVIEINGEYRGQPDEFQKDFLECLSLAGRNIKYNGPYEETRIDAMMQQVDFVVMPSVWWENSPVVIQEAFRNQQPVICSNIGGMAEKIRDGVDGLHFPVANSTALAALFLKLAKTPAILQKLRSTMQRPLSAAVSISSHTQIYRSLVA